MNTEELLSVLEKQFLGWNRDGERGIRHYLNITQRILCNIACDQLMIFNESTGKLPTFSTTAGTFTYNLPSNVNFIDTVLVESSVRCTLNDNLSAQDYGFSSRVSQQPLEEVEISGINYYKIPYIRSYPATEDNPAKVMFTVEPGTSTYVYRYRGYLLVPEIVSDTIPLSIPPPHDAMILLPATAKMIEGVQNGTYAETYRDITGEYQPKMQEAFNVGAFGINQEAEDHGF